MLNLILKKKRIEAFCPPPPRGGQKVPPVLGLSVVSVWGEDGEAGALTPPVFILLAYRTSPAVTERLGHPDLLAGLN